MIGCGLGVFSVPATPGLEEGRCRGEGQGLRLEVCADRTCLWSECAMGQKGGAM